MKGVTVNTNIFFFKKRVRVTQICRLRPYSGQDYTGRSSGMDPVAPRKVTVCPGPPPAAAPSLWLTQPPPCWRLYCCRGTWDMFIFRTLHSLASQGGHGNEGKLRGGTCLHGMDRIQLWLRRAASSALPGWTVSSPAGRRRPPGPASLWIRGPVLSDFCWKSLFCVLCCCLWYALWLLELKLLHLLCQWLSHFWVSASLYNNY